MERDSLDPAAIKSAVQDFYSRAARSAGEGCCGLLGGTASDAACGCGARYSPDEVAFLPAEAVRSSRGCGNPAALASLRPGEVVLDLGCGGGLDVLLAARRVGPGGFVYGLDMTDAMLELARRNAARAGVENVAFLKGDIEVIPLADASADVIISNCVINLMPDKKRAFREAFRVLRPGGKLAVSDVVIEGDFSMLPVSEAVFRRALSWSACLAGALTTAQYRCGLAAAGFAEIHLAVERQLSLCQAAADVVDSVSLEACFECCVPGSGPVPDWLEELAGRFGSAAITARKPPV